MVIQDEIFIKYIPHDEKREMIIDYAEINGIVDALKIADSLHLDVFDVNEIMIQLIDEGILGEYD